MKLRLFFFLCALGAQSGCAETQDSLAPSGFFGSADGGEISHGRANESGTENAVNASLLTFVGDKGEEVLTIPEIEQYCARFSEDVYFEATESDPQEFLLYGEGDYCALLQRQSGYLTLSHEEGEVRRDGDQWSWCITMPQEVNGATGARATSREMSPSRLVVRSLSPRAWFSVRLQRGSR